MSVSISPVLNGQNFDANGNPLNGGKIFTYLAGSSTLATTYTDSAGLVAQSNPIILNTRGETDNLIWITDDLGYKFVLKDSSDNTLRTLDNISNSSPATITQDEWIDYTPTATYVSTSQFSVAGDKTSIFNIGRRVKAQVSAGTVYGTITAATFSSVTTVSVKLDSGVLDSGLSGVSYGLISKDNTSSPFFSTLYQSMRNKVNNGDFRVNQRAVSGTVTLSAGAYGHDRWKAGASGCTYTFATSNGLTTLTITAGSLQQVIEADDLPSGTNTMVMSWTGTAQGKIGAGSYSATGVTGSVAGGSNLTIEFNTGTLANVQLEQGLVSTIFEKPSLQFATSQCQRYYWRLSQALNADLGLGYHRSSTSFVCSIVLPVTMRASPTFLIQGASSDYSVQSGASTLTVSNISALVLSNNRCLIDATTSAGTAGNAGRLYPSGGTRFFEFSADL